MLASESNRVTMPGPAQEVGDVDLLAGDVGAVLADGLRLGVSDSDMLGEFALRIEHEEAFVASADVDRGGALGSTVPIVNSVAALSGGHA
jgi:hypothetical protein